MNLFIEEIKSRLPSNIDGLVGYAEDEICQIERLYGICVRGQLREFLLAAGRSGGSLLGDDPIILFRNSWPVRGQILFQVKMFTYLQEIGAWNYLNKPFVVSLESETQYYYLQTDSEEYDLVYHYDENNDTVECTNTTLFEYLKDVASRYGLCDVKCQGELLRI